MNYTFDDIKIKKNANQDQEIIAATAFLFIYLFIFFQYGGEARVPGRRKTFDTEKLFYYPNQLSYKVRSLKC